MGVSVNGAPSSDRIQAAQQSRGPERALFGKLDFEIGARYCTADRRVLRYDHADDFLEIA